MRPSTDPTCSLRAMWKLGLLVLVVLLPLLLLSCASTKQLAQELEENHGNFLTPSRPPSRRRSRRTSWRARNRKRAPLLRFARWFQKMIFRTCGVASVFITSTTTLTLI
jgi:hypothetical protein